MPNKRDDFNVTGFVLLKKKDFVVPPTTGLIEFDDSVKFNGQFNMDGELVVDNATLDKRCKGEFLRDQLIPLLEQSRGYALFMVVWDNGLNGIEEMGVLDGTITWKPYL